jgi:two-component system sensor histidine kinase KdpD
MLEAARQRLAEGVDVAIGYVETHHRAETEAMAAGLETIARRQVEYRGSTLPEMDVDAILARRPQLVLVDELAHTNAPGSRHPKRHQDVDELLSAGLDVYTTLNIQHLESLNDVVAQITGVIVRETVPDRLLDAAAEIEVTDLPPGELLQRLKEGKVYLPDQAARAIRQFFRQGNLTALREIALRRAAERVDDQMRAYMETRAIAGPWAAHERLLVLVSPSPLSERLVRSARRLADELNAEWIALYVEGPGQAGLTPARREQAARVLQLAEELGAKAVTLPGQSVAETALAYARQNNVTKIIAGKPLQPRWRELLGGSVVDQLIRRGGQIDIYVISGEGAASAPRPDSPWQPHRPYRRYLNSTLLVLATTLLGFALDPALSLEKLNLLAHMLATGQRPDLPLREHVIEPTNLAMLFLVAVVISALNWGRGPAIWASVLSVLAIDFIFVQPYLTFAVSDTQYVLTFLALLGVGVVMSTLAARAREQTDAARQREAETAELYGLSRDLAATSGLPGILDVLVTHLEHTFGREVAVLLPEEAAPNQLAVRAASANLRFDENERAVADWVFQHGEPAGRNTNTLPAAQVRYLPLKTAQRVLGVLGVAGPAAAERPLTPRQRRLIEAFASQASLAIERAWLAEAARQAQVFQAAERLQTALLNSVSHDLRTPLVSITGALSSLQEDGTALDAVTRRTLVDNAREEAERLNRLVGNLLDMTRLESGPLKVKHEPVDLEDLIGSALEQLGARARGRQVSVQVEPELPLVPADFVLLAQVLVNLLDNALKYSPPDTPIAVSARLEPGGREARLDVADHGSGIPPADLTQIFDKFYRVQRPGSAGGTGLGLSICRGIVEAHGGRIWAENRPEGGALFAFTVPLSHAG